MRSDGPCSVTSLSAMPGSTNYNTRVHVCKRVSIRDLNMYELYTDELLAGKYHDAEQIITQLAPC